VAILGGMLGMSWHEISARYDDGTLWPPNVAVEQYLLDLAALREERAL